MKDIAGFSIGEVSTNRHRTAYIEIGPKTGPLMIFVHGHPELGVMWRSQMEHFAAAGWRCVAPDMRGYGGSTIHAAVSSYSVREIVADMVELHDALGATPAVWVGHDWGAPIAWAMASHYPERARAIMNMSVPYLSRGFALPHLVALVDRDLYPVEQYPVGQWDYWLYYREQFEIANRDFEIDVPGTIAALYQPGNPEAVGKPAFTATLRQDQGWFGPNHRAPQVAPDFAMIPQDDYELFVSAFSQTGFAGVNAWYLNDAANIAYAAEARNFGHLDMPVLFFHGAFDVVCETINSRLADPMREDCTDLSEVTIQGGHFFMLERKAQVNVAMQTWLDKKGIK
ncbi:alpha/beta hydrolase [Pseudomonas dryadis]|uniref:Alpha/beta hydrolase n=2 Tax=Phytopseudomonas dryadis TaxID=2487520 RepID=A0A4Q9QTR9_9GAMM|nr:alpha/beta hydrolase [Pseudomonas dryadis]